MKNDILLQKFFEPERWETAINDGVNKHMDKGIMRKLTTPEVRIALYTSMVDGSYNIEPPHQAQIPKGNGEFRIVYVNDNLDRIVLSIINNLFFETFPEFIHPCCKSYQSGIGCGKIVQEVSRQVVNSSTNTVGFKADLTKYFDTVPIKYIDDVFDRMESKVGKSKLIDLVRKYYHNDLCVDLDGNLIHKYQSLKQGCAVASFLADAVLYRIDYIINSLPVYYVRYSDDLLVLGDDYATAFHTLKSMLHDMEMTLNPKKVELIHKDSWFKFLGFLIKNDSITLSRDRVKSFQKEIEKCAIKPTKMTQKRAINCVNAYLYKGDGKYAWATSVLPIINVEKDIDTLNEFVMDSIRACATNKKKIGGLGSVKTENDFTILRGTGKNVTANRLKTHKEIEGFLSLRCMRNAILTNKPLYETLVRHL